jgi:hypothetical protein
MGGLNNEILMNVPKPLKDKETCFFTILNGLFPLFRSMWKYQSLCTWMADKSTFPILTFNLHDETDSGKLSEVVRRTAELV